nr:nitrogen permease regulator 3 [Quercus suber]
MDRSSDHFGILAILLVIRSRPGPKLVFHYPARPSLAGKTGERDLESELEDLSEDEYAKDTADLEQKLFEQPLWKDQRSNQVLERSTLNEREEAAVRVESILGHSVESLETLLSPGRWSNGRKFEVEMDGITFIGHPTFAAVDGTWSDLESAELSQLSPRYMHVDETRSNSIATHGTSGIDQPSQVSAQSSSALPDISKKAISRDFTHIPDSFDSQRGASLATSLNSTSTSSGPSFEQMTMFNVLMACAGELKTQMNDLHQYVLVKLSEALLHCQQQSNYVGAESRKISKLKVKAKREHLGLEAESTLLLEGSDLAWAMMEAYEKLRIGDIATFKLNGMEMSVHIPSSFLRDKSRKTKLSPHTGLLLLESKEALLRELKHPDTAPLAYFIQEHTPTKSLQKHAINLRLPIEDILYLAQHLITWRKARVIAPLHQRNFYVAAPSAPLDQASQRAPGLLRRFPALPSLPMMLQMLSGRPIKYGLLIPSRDHRQTYMDLLAYLLRHGFVVQLKTSGWLMMPENLKQLRLQGDADVARTTNATSLLSPHIKNLEDDTASVSSERTAIPFVSAVAMKDRIRQLSDDSKAATDMNDISDHKHVIRHPAEPSSEEAQALEYIRSTIADTELQEHFSSLLQYFDGEHVLEEIAAHRGMKRAKLEAWLEILTQSGHLMTFSYL